jgi:fatty acid desaturase
MTIPTISVGPARHQRWTLDDIPWGKIERGVVVAEEELLLLVATASFVEIATDLFARNLLERFAGEADVGTWLDRHWQHEELQHGRALKRYVEVAWPDFDWAKVHRSFFEEFSATCKMEALEPTRALEMASRCVVEMGTASYYTTLSRLSPEPVLRQLAAYIAEDEVRHYKHFYRYFCRFRDLEGPGRARIALALWRRLKMIRDDDGYIAFKHVYAARHTGERLDRGVYRKVRRQCKDLVVGHFPHEMSVKMLLKPLDLAPSTRRVAQSTLEALARRLVA